MPARTIRRDRFGFLHQFHVLRAQNELAAFLETLPGADRAFVAPTFAGPALEALLHTLSETLSDYAIQAVIDDLTRLESSGILYQRKFDGKAMTAARIDAAFATRATFPARPVSHDDALQRYENWILGRSADAPEAAHPVGAAQDYYIDAFYRRHSAAWYAIDLISSNFTRNIVDACTRLVQDRTAIAQLFFPDHQLRSLARITATGSDSHKQGRQVLILDFNTVDAAQQPQIRRLVYKPSDVETDYALVGRNAALREFLAAHANDAGYPAYRESLAEQLNRFCEGANTAVAGRLWPEATPAQLPDLLARMRLGTYLILPRNPGSRFPDGGDRLPIETSYGWVEFLTHEPQLDVPYAGAATDAAIARALADRAPAPTDDWVTSDPRLEQVLYYQWGQLLVLTLVAGTSDVHVQNQIVHDLKPHLIDLEESFKPVRGFRTSYITGFYARLNDPSAPVAQYALSERPSEHRPLSQDLDHKVFVVSRNQLFVRDDVARASRATPDRRGNLPLVFDGILAATRALRENAHDVLAWLEGCRTLVVRHVPEATPNFARALRDLYREMLTAESAGELPAPVTRDGHAAWLRRLSGSVALGKLKRWRTLTNNPRPYILLESVGNNLRDYANFDVPFYVRRVGSQDVYNSAGQRVDLQQAWQQLAAVWAELGLDPGAQPVTPHYFDVAMPDALMNQVAGWRDDTEEAFVAEVTGLIRAEFQAAGEQPFGFLAQLLPPQADAHA